MLGLFLVFALVAGDPATANTPTAPIITEGYGWSQRPGGQDFVRVYPRAALRKGLSGRAMISCTVGADGRLTDCAVIAEDPAGEGFGQAALRLSRLFRMKTPPDKPTPAGAVVRIPLVWNPPPSN